MQLNIKKITIKKMIPPILGYGKYIRCIDVSGLEGRQWNLI